MTAFAPEEDYILMKLITVFLLYTLATFSYAGCFQDISSDDIKLSVQKTPESDIQDDNHRPLTIVKVSVLASYDGSSLGAMFLTKGEVYDFWYPIAYKIKDGIASTELRGSLDSIKNLEMNFYYTIGECTLYLEALL